MDEKTGAASDEKEEDCFFYSKSSSKKSSSSNPSSVKSQKQQKGGGSAVAAAAPAGKPKWKLNDEQKVFLLKHVFNAGAHISGHGKTLVNFKEVNRELFAEECMQDDKEEHFRDHDAGARKIQEKYNATMKEARDMMKGNLSAREGDRKDLVIQAQKIDEDIAAEKERKAAEEKQTKELNDIEGNVLNIGNKPNPLEIKNLDGTRTSNKDPNKTTKKSFEEMLLESLRTKPADTTTVAQGLVKSVETDILKNMLQWTQKHGKTIANLDEMKIFTTP
jgi:hypothetical protein